jgi:flagellar biosynthesis/type III secretory pathway chaperone
LDPSSKADPHADPSVWGPRLERLIARQTELYEQLLEMTESQRDLIDGDDEGEALVELLRARQGYVDEVAQHNELLEPFVSRWEELSASLDEATRASLTEKLSQLMELIDRMVKRDEAGREAIEARREALSGELNTISRNKTAVSTYARSGVTNPPRYQDRRA